MELWPLSRCMSSTPPKRRSSVADMMMMGTWGRRLRSLAATSVPNLLPSFASGGHDDDGRLGTALAQLGSDFGAEFAVAEVVVEDCNIDLVEQLIGFLDRSEEHTSE